MASLTHQDIAQRAHDIYVESGYQQGQCDENWKRAELDLRNHGAAACQAQHHVQAVFAPDSVHGQ